MSRRFLVVFGTRPEAIKMAPVVRTLRSRPDCEVTVAVTAQHREMLDQVLELFEIVPDHDLDIMEHGQSLTQITCRVLEGIGGILDRERFDAVVVHGDTTTTFATALAAFYHQVPVAHVEAGMRTGDIMCPFPEEANRSLTARLVRWHFAPSVTCEENLLREGIDPDRVFRTPRNTVVDALLHVRDVPYEFPGGPVACALFSGRRIVLVTAHRRESWGRGMEAIFSAVARLAEAHPDIHVLLATHANPVVADAADRILASRERVDIIGPQDYLPFVKLLDAAHLILSDSGGIQEEGPALGTPVVVLRDVTEYPELLGRGVVVLAGTDEDGIFEAVSRLLRDEGALARMRQACEETRTQDASSAIAEVLCGGS
ncbi:MAG: UDP-N-acetylglucosamine 2-epimerase (non-hydrolyzing) [Coriobacteriia bacterium]|nr:UDP-N-acetylglucosamine 2-epimerase (non-hydrolyzing) [Coriobacteriia bacterium]